MRTAKQGTLSAKGILGKEGGRLPEGEIPPGSYLLLQQVHKSRQLGLDLLNLQQGLAELLHATLSVLELSFAGGQLSAESFLFLPRRHGIGKREI